MTIISGNHGGASDSASLALAGGEEVRRAAFVHTIVVEL